MMSQTPCSQYGGVPIQLKQWLSCLILIAMTPLFSYADAVTDYNLAIEFYKQQRWKLAADACETFVTEYPTHDRVPVVHLYWGQSLVHLRDFQNARAKFERFLKDSPNSSDRPLAMYRIGECSYFVNDLDRAKAELTAFLKSYNSHELAEWAIIYLGEVEFRRGEQTEAVKAFQYYLDNYPGGKLQDDAEYSLARAFEANGQAEEANKLYQKISNSTTHPRAADALFNLAAAQFAAGNYSAAAEAFSAVGSRFPSHRLVPLASLNAGYAHYQQQQFKEAIEQFKIAQTLPEQKENADYWTGLSYKSLSEFEQAVEVFSRSLNDNPKQALAPNLHFQWGDSALRLGNLDVAIAQFETVYQNWPDSEYADDSVHSACEAAFRLGDLERAEALNLVFNQSYAEGGLRMVQQLLAGRVLIARSDAPMVEAAQREELLNSAVELLSGVAETSTIPQTSQLAQFQLARAYERLEKNQEVIDTISALLKSETPLEDELVHDAHLLLANARLRLDDFPNSMQGFRDVIDSAESDAERMNGLTGLIVAATEHHEWQIVRQSLQQLKEIDKEDRQLSRLAIAAGDTAFEIQEWEEAESFFKMVISRNQDNDAARSAYSGLGHAFFKQEKFEESAHSFAALADLADKVDELKTHAFYMQATALRNAEQLENALLAFEEGVSAYQEADFSKLSEETQENIYRLAKSGARVARELERIDVANKLYQVAFNQMKSRPAEEQSELDRLIFEWADVNYNADDYKRADELYQLLVQERPDSPLADDASLILAESLRFDEQSAEAIKAFQTILADPNADEFVRRRSLVHMTDLSAESEDWETVLSSARMLRDEFPMNSHSQYAEYRIGEALLQTGANAEAYEQLNTLRDSIRQELDNAPVWWAEVWILYAESALRLKEYEELRAAIEELQSLDPMTSAIQRGELLVGQSYEQQARFDDARRAYLRIVSSPTGRGTETAAEAQFRIAESFLKQENFELALKEYYKVYAGYDAPTYEAAALFQAARSDAAMKQWQGALKSYQTLLDEFPDSQYAPEAQTQIDQILQAIPELKSEKE
ncbi:tetratricopeptide repeat protein [Thalassoglobus sp. JC818]|uniref:tetratricopeptide repeat protein n=1 Tax=Thalassoglobus sp. JC818 TaxID=3232136 RepID=UPI003459C525